MSIFVNPLQFSNQADLDNYPDTWKSDLKLCKKLGVDYIFAPTAIEIYPMFDGDEMCPVKPMTKFADTMEGSSRPCHLEGMLSVVNKLFNIVQPHSAYFR